MNNDFEINIPITREQQDLIGKMTASVKDVNIKAVSFKLFGCLVLLPFSEDHDLYMLMEKEFPDVRTSKRSFSDLRIEAEIEAEKKFPENCSVTLDQIYEVLAKKAKIDDELRSRLMKRECEILVSLAFPRNFGKMLFNTANASGKKTIIAADTVYPKAVISEILEKCGYDDHSGLVITNEVKASKKRSEDIFEAVLKYGNLKPQTLIHIGSNVADDVETPILKGSRSLLLSDPSSNMIRSGKLRGFVQAERIFDYDTAEFLAFHLALGLYSAYIFDIPRTKTVHSDFCGNAYILGFIVYGCCRLGNISELDEKERSVFEALEKNKDMRRGGDDFYELFMRHFDLYLGKLSYNGFTLPLELLAEHGDTMDIGLLKNTMSSADHKTLKDGLTDAPTAPTARKNSEQNKLEKLADRMFPPGTKVRNLTEGMLFKLKQRRK